MSAVHRGPSTGQLPIAQETVSHAAPVDAGVRGRLARRALAVIVALAVMGVLGVGWLADSVGMATPETSQGALSQQVGLARVTLTMAAPDQAGGGALLLRVTDVAGKPVVGARATCALSMTGMGMSLPAARAQPTSTPGEYRCAAAGLMPGAWTLALALTPPGGETGHATFQFVVA